MVDYALDTQDSQNIFSKNFQHHDREISQRVGLKMCENVRFSNVLPDYHETSSVVATHPSDSKKALRIKINLLEGYQKRWFFLN